MDFTKFSGKRICVAISGGADSVALLHYLKTQSGVYGFSLIAVHCEHGIRGEASLADMRFVERFCEALGVPVYVFKEDCPLRAQREKTSLETAARNFRYACFSALIAEGKAEYIATAHHQDDQAETVLFRISRGAALSGAVGMTEENGYLLRPFLRWSKTEILQYLAEHNLSYCVDETNADTAYTRNKLRLDILPKLNECVAGAAENIARFAERAALDDALLYEYAETLLKAYADGEMQGYLVEFSEKEPLFTRACLLAMKGLGVEKDYTSVHLTQAFALQGLERGAKLDLPKGLQAEKTETGVLFHRKDELKIPLLAQPKSFALDGFDGGKYEVILSETPIGGEQTPWRILRADADKIPKTAVFRFRKDGDVMQTFGGRKTLKKFLNERKVPVECRMALPLIAEESGEVYAVCGVEISEKIKIDENTKRAVYIAMKRK